MNKRNNSFKLIRKISFTSLVILLTIILVLLQLFLSNRLMVEGKKIEKIQLEISKLEEEKNYLKNKMASLTCLSELVLKAEEKGFVKNPPVVNLSGKVPIAAYSQKD